MAEEHLSGLATTTGTVVLRGVSDLKHVNALAGDRRLPFAVKGLTVIYGDNGSGKSGYGRVLKHVCRCRSKKPAIHSNVYEPAPTAASSATIEFSLDGNPQTYAWVSASSPTTFFGQVSFFDSDCASYYIETKTNIAYRPFGLDILPKLVEVCDRIRAVLQSRIDALSARRTFSGFTNGTLAGKFIDSLSRTPTHAELEAVCGKYVDTAPRIAELRGLLAALDTKTVNAKATDLRLKAKRFRHLGQTLDELSTSLAEAKFCALRDAKDDRDAKRAAAAASQTFQPQVLAGIGTHAWLVLWNAAKQYSSESAYPGMPFPITDGEALCVLCQQPLGAAGVQRMEKLEEFVQREVHKQAEVAERSFGACRDGFANLTVPDSDSLDVLVEIRELDEALVYRPTLLVNY